MPIELAARAAERRYPPPTEAGQTNLTTIVALVVLACAIALALVPPPSDGARAAMTVDVAGP